MLTNVNEWLNQFIVSDILQHNLPDYSLIMFKVKIHITTLYLWQCCANLIFLIPKDTTIYFI